ncbi:flagellar hook protein FlgE [Radicibacter daui]|uniref:flagellar hook protein FlgE n=1 Tax=Radicibacter daui TaxID=3064829 RepID=UPI0040468F9C
MSLSGAMNSAVSALNAQSYALSLISSNLANSSTVGYKTVDASFSDIVTQQSSLGTKYASGAVRATSVQNISTQGLLSSSTSATSLAISGDGFFPITDGVDGEQTYYTRDGEFTVNDDGYLVNGDYYLVGWTTDSDGNVTSANTNSVDALEPINIEKYSSSAEATTTASLEANLPADAEVGDTFDTSIDVYDSLGNTQAVSVTWTKTDTNEWTMTVNDPTDPSSGEATGTAGGTTSYTISFNDDGTLNTITDSSGNTVTEPTITIDSWDDGAGASSISLNLGTSGEADGLTQYTTGDDDPQVSVESIDTDGVQYGSLTGVSIASDGTVTAVYSNGQELPIYKIPIVTFPAENNLEILSDGVYAQTTDSGNYTLHVAGEDGAGSISSYYLEESTTDTATEFSKMIVAQQAYSAASQVVTTVKDMYDSLLQAVR